MGQPLLARRRPGIGGSDQGCFARRLQWMSSSGMWRKHAYAAVETHSCGAQLIGLEGICRLGMLLVRVEQALQVR